MRKISANRKKGSRIIVRQVAVLYGEALVLSIDLNCTHTTHQLRKRYIDIFGWKKFQLNVRIDIKLHERLANHQQSAKLHKAVYNYHHHQRIDPIPSFYCGNQANVILSIIFNWEFAYSEHRSWQYLIQWLKIGWKRIKDNYGFMSQHSGRNEAHWRQLFYFFWEKKIIYC